MNKKVTEEVPRTNIPDVFLFFFRDGSGSTKKKKVECDTDITHR